MKYLSNNFTGDEYSFRHTQVMRGLTKGRDELIKMTSKCLFAVPIFYLLFSDHDHEHGASFLHAVLSVLHKFEQELDDKEVDQQDYILIHQPGRKWGLYIHSNVNDRQPEEKKWSDILCPQKCDVVHCCWWRQFHLNDKVVAGDLQRLSREYAIRVLPDDESPLVGFKLHYPLLLSAWRPSLHCMHLIVDLLSKYLGKNLRVGTGMDKVDAQRNYNTSTEYNFCRKRRRQQVIDESRPNKPLKSIIATKPKLNWQ